MASNSENHRSRRPGEAPRDSDRVLRNEPPKVQPQYAREEVGAQKREPPAQKQGGENLREKLERPAPRPGPDAPGLGSLSQGQIETPKPPRYGDPNVGNAAITKAREERQAREQAQEQKQEQRR